MLDAAATLLGGVSVVSGATGNVSTRTGRLARMQRYADLVEDALQPATHHGRDSTAPAPVHGLVTPTAAGISRAPGRATPLPSLVHP
jgi:hypothetical protein